MNRFLLNLALILCLSSSAFADGPPLVVENHSFEVDSVTPFPTYRTSITSWTVSASGYGVNTTAGPFMDNGAIPDGTKVLFLQQAKAISQNVAGFQAGQYYTIRLHVNSRASTADAQLQVSVGGNIIVPSTTISPVGGTNPFRVISKKFLNAVTGTLEVKIENLNGAVDNSLLVDNVEIFQTPAAAQEWQHLP